MNVEHTKGGRSKTPNSAAVGVLQVAADGSLLVSSDVRYIRQITPGAADIANGPCNAILLASDATVTLQGSEDDTSIAIPLKGGVWHPNACIKVTVCAVNIWGGWLRKPL